MKKNKKNYLILTIALIAMTLCFVTGTNKDASAKIKPIVPVSYKPVISPDLSTTCCVLGYTACLPLNC